MENEEFAVFSRDSNIEVKVKWYLKTPNILILGIVLGTIFNLSISAIINLTVDDGIRQIFLMWQKIPINVWISVLSFISFIIFVYYVRLTKHKNEQ